MPLVTVCIPAYRSGPKITATLNSVRHQSFHDFRCVVGFDPPVANDMVYVEPFLSDPRFRCHENPERLGWDGNVSALMARVETPFFTVLLHDDLIHPAYLETLIALMATDDSLALAYSDLWQFGGHDIPSINFVDIPEEGSRTDQIMAFLLQRTEAAPWRGLVRSEVLLDHAFFVDGYGGFATECEWTLRLLVHGPARRVPRPLYYKRYSAAGITTASQRWADLKLDELIAAWTGHRMRMLGLLEELVEVDQAQRRLFTAGAEAALLSRLVQAVRVGRVPADVQGVMQNHIGRANSKISYHLRRSGTRGPLIAKIESMRMMANALWAIWHEDWAEGLALSSEAAAQDPENVEAIFTCARMLIRLRRHQEALDSALAVLSLTPHKRGLPEILRSISNAMMLEAGKDQAGH